MLSRSASLVRTNNLLKQALRPSSITALPATTTTTTTTTTTRRNTSSYVTKEAKYWDTAYPAFVEYKQLAGSSAGPLFGAGLLTYLLSKEIYVVNDETMQFYVQAIVFYHLYKMGSGPAAKYFEKQTDDQLEELYSTTRAKLSHLEQELVDAASVDKFLDDRPEYYAIMQNQKEMAAEVTYRQRLQEVEAEFKKRLDYQVEMQNVQLAIEEKHVAAWIEKEVLKSISEESEEDTMQQCLTSLEQMAAANTA